MKKHTFKKFLALTLVATLSITLSACSKVDYSTEAPYGSITGNYASNGDTTLTNKQLYDLLRPSSYGDFFYEIESIILNDYITDLNYNDDKEEMAELLNELIFETDDINEILTMSTTSRDLKLEQLSDSMYTSNIVFAPEDIKFTDTAVVYPEVLFDYFTLNLAKERFAVDALETEIAKGEEIDDEDNEGKTIDNPYYITEKAIESYYNNTYVSKQDFNAIIVGFNTIAEAEAAWDDVQTYLNDDLLQGNPVERAFVNLYNNAYPYKTQLKTPESHNDQGFYEDTIVNSTSLAKYNSSLVSYLIDMDVNTYTNDYKEFGDKVYYIFKVSDYQYSTKDKWKDLDAADRELLTPEIKQELFDAQLTDSFISTQINNIIEDLLEENKIEIFDPILALTFDYYYEDYTYSATELKSTTNVATIDGVDITVDAFFDKIKGYYGASTAYSFLTSAALADSRYIDELEDEDIEAAEDAFDAELSKFKANSYASSGITKYFSESDFLLMMYGYDNEGDVLEYHYQPLQALQYVGQIQDDNYFELLELMSKNNYYNYYSLNIKHVLLFVDYDLDGTMDDPQTFMNKLSADDKLAFEQTIINIYTAIYNEVTYLDLGESAGLDYVAKAYNQNKELIAPDNKTLFDNVTNPTWEDIKNYEGTNFNIQIKVEELGSVDTSNGSNYVAEFTNHVQNMYNSLKDTFIEEEYDGADYEEDKKFITAFGEFLNDNHLEEIKVNTPFEDLCMSSFGFHMLLSTKGSTASSSIFLSTTDYPENTGDEFNRYDNIFVEFNGEEDYIDAYSTTPYPSINQLKIYVYEKDTDDGIENIKSYTETIINGFYSNFTSRLSNQIFMNHYIYQELNMDITFDANSNVDTNMSTRWFEISQKSLNNYSTDTGSIYAGMWDLVIDIYSRETL